jgi:hypothetical protein
MSTRDDGLKATPDRKLLNHAASLLIATLAASKNDDDTRYRAARAEFRAIARRMGASFPSLLMDHMVARLDEVRRNARRDAMRHWPELAWIDLGAIEPWGRA